MKDPVRHMEKLSRRVIRSVEHEVEQGLTLPAISPRKQTERQLKKQAKAKIRKERKARIPVHPTLEERNRIMKHRVPIFDSWSHNTPKSTKKSQKKMPPL